MRCSHVAQLVFLSTWRLDRAKMTTLVKIIACLATTLASDSPSFFSQLQRLKGHPNNSLRKTYCCKTSVSIWLQSMHHRNRWATYHSWTTVKSRSIERFKWGFLIMLGVTSWIGRLYIFFASSRNPRNRSGMVAGIGDSNSAKKSMSLESLSSPRATDPKTDKRLTPNCLHNWRAFSFESIIEKHGN